MISTLFYLAAGALCALEGLQVFPGGFSQGWPGAACIALGLFVGGMPTRSNS